MTTSRSRPALKLYLVCYGSENKSWLCDAENRDHAVEQFNNAAMDGEINEVFEWSATNRYFVRQRRLRWVCFVQEVDAEDEDAAIDAFEDEFDPQHSFIESAVPYIADGPAAVFDRQEYPTRKTSPTPTDAGAALPE